MHIRPIHILRFVFPRVVCFLGIASLGIASMVNAEEIHPVYALDIRGKAMVFAHRGASQELPEHTLAAYQLAMEQGAHFIEPDLHLTRDGVLIALHDTSLNRTTNVADVPAFAARGRIDDKGRTVWSPRDFTADELKQLSIRPGNRSGSRTLEETLRIPTLEQIVELVRAYHGATGRLVGLVPEFKHREMADAFVAFVRTHELDHPVRGLPIYMQSFSLDDLKQVRGRVPFPAALLGSDFPPTEKWVELRKHVDAFSPNKKAVLAEGAAARIAAAHVAGFDVFAYTFADDAYDTQRFSSAEQELRRALQNGVDAFFTDSPASGVRVHTAWRIEATAQP